MQRRTLLKQLAFATGGAMLLPACVRDIRQGSLALKNLKVSASQEDLVAAIMETIIPTTDTPGAKDLQLQQFALRMIDDCFAPEDQQTFLAGLSEFEKLAEEKLGDPFLEADRETQEKFVRELDGAKSGNDETEKKKTVHAFYSMLKNLTIHGYTTSEYVMTNQLHYNMIPGRFQGCVEVTDAKDFKTILG